MRAAVVLAVGVAAQIMGCTQTPDPSVEQPAWARFDCRMRDDGPEIHALFEQAQAICAPRAEAAAIAGTSGMPVGHGLAGAIASGISSGIAQGQISRATLSSCMAEQGYTLRTRSQHDELCADIRAARNPPAKTRVPVAKRQAVKVTAARSASPRQAPAPPAASAAPEAEPTE